MLKTINFPSAGNTTVYSNPVSNGSDYSLSGSEKGDLYYSIAKSEDVLWKFLSLAKSGSWEKM